ncbi:hypothetical protein REPUB_Repub19eG0056100 [Reevesia pubescens]
MKLVYSGTSEDILKFLAIREAFLIYAASNWGKSHRLLVESDSVNAVKWVKDPESVPWRLKKFCAVIKYAKTEVLDWQIAHVPRECNEFADKLAKDGVARSSDLFVVY